MKKDAIWKPLIRQFRRFVKQTCMKNINHHSTHWASTIEQRAQAYAKAMQIPDNFELEKTGFAILLMVESSKITK